MKKIVIDGNEAAARASYMFTEVAGIYPITPASPMAEYVDGASAKGAKNIFNDNVKVIEMQSEAGAAGMVHGSLQAGAMTTTFTASQGLLLMIPNMYKIAGEMLPSVFHVASRSIAGHALSIFGDHQDIYAARATGFCFLSSANPEEANHLATVSHLATYKASLPIVHFFDGFRTSHELQKINILEESDISELIPYDKINEFRDRGLNPLKPVMRGTAQNDDIYFQASEVRNQDYLNTPDIINDYMEKINAITGTNYKPFNYYGADDATRVIIAMGSVCETTKEVVDKLNSMGEKVGLITVHLYRPFSIKYLFNVMPSTVTNIAVLDRTTEKGSSGEPLYLDIVNAVMESKRKINVVGGRYGLSSKNAAPADINAVFTNMASEVPLNGFTIGINDDVTHLSLPVPERFETLVKNESYLIYGYGSDGMVSAAKAMIKLIGDNTDNYVQGYFRYDSKKSGGITIGNLRFSEEKITSTYYVDKANLLACTKESYLNKYDMFKNLSRGGIFILNTGMSGTELNNYIDEDVKKEIIDKEIKVYTIDAYKLAAENNLRGRISTIMEAAILMNSNLIEFETVKEKMKYYVEKSYGHKGQEILDANYKVIDLASSYLKELDTSVLTYNEVLDVNDETMNQVINAGRGDDLPVSAFLKMKDGTFEADTAKLEKRGVSEKVPMWIPENCIECNKCSFVCPHGVIRPFLLTKEEAAKLPPEIERKVPMAPNLKDYVFIITPSSLDCTGCGLCVNSCPGKGGKKALEMVDLKKSLDIKTDVAAEYLFNDDFDKKVMNKFNIKGSQYVRPKFEFSGACAGCGETPYIKTLTQLFGDRMIVANATGCSSIYGGTAPNAPYNLPWANSLFEDNAEFSYGILLANETLRNRLRKEFVASLNMQSESNKDLINKWLENMNDYDITKEVYDNLDFSTLPKIIQLKDYIISRSIWSIGGDGWAYDIGFGGLDHVLSSPDNVNVLVLNTEVYSNTGGQSSKASPMGSIAKFTASGKKVGKKDLAAIAMNYPNCYVAQVSMGYNGMQFIKALKEAEAHDGPSLIIAYSPCIAHGIKGGLGNSMDTEQLATASGYFPIFRYDPVTDNFTLDSKNTDFDRYEEYLETENRYKMLKAVNPEKAIALLEQNKKNAMKRFNYYKLLDEQDND